MLIRKPLHTIGDRLHQNGGIGPGFDAMRLALSCAVVCWHSLPLSYGWPVEQAVWISAVGRPFMAVMPIFFALSGFLVMGSALRLSALTPYLLSRGLRILPALATEITVSALLIGSTLTSLPLREYFTNPEFFEYFGSLIGRVVFTLPGVIFNGNPYPQFINNNLWTIPPELLCYVFMSMMIVIGFYKNRWFVIGSAFVILAMNVGYDLSFGPDALDARWPGRFLVLAFALGAAAYLFRDVLPYNRWLALGCLVFGLVFLRTPFAMYASIAALVFVTAYLGATSLPLHGIFKRGDYSYGIYLYGFPIQQLVAYLVPNSHEFYWNILFALPITICVAVVSWHFVEKPTLSLRKKIAKPAVSKPMGPVSTFLMLAGLGAYAAFLLRFSQIAFLERTTLHYLVFVFAIITLFAALITAVKWLIIARASTTRNAANARADL